jgi:hypothetical protein
VALQGALERQDLGGPGRFHAISGVHYRIFFATMEEGFGRAAAEKI